MLTQPRLLVVQAQPRLVLQLVGTQGAPLVVSLVELGVPGSFVRLQEGLLNGSRLVVLQVPCQLLEVGRWGLGGLWGLLPAGRSEALSTNCTLTVPDPRCFGGARWDAGRLSCRPGKLARMRLDVEVAWHK